MEAFLRRHILGLAPGGGSSSLLEGMGRLYPWRSLGCTTQERGCLCVVQQGTGLGAAEEEPWHLSGEVPGAGDPGDAWGLGLRPRKWPH
jgi:hypothetical protein